MLVRKSLKLISAFFVMTGLSYAMGETSPMESVPTGITCKIVDNTGTVHVLQNCNCDGRTYISVKRGSLSYFVDLNSVRSIDIRAFKTNEVLAYLKTTTNPEGSLVSISKDTICYGLGSFGNAKFYIKNIKDFYVVKP